MKSLEDLTLSAMVEYNMETRIWPEMVRNKSRIEVVAKCNDFVISQVGTKLTKGLEAYLALGRVI